MRIGVMVGEVRGPVTVDDLVAQVADVVAHGIGTAWTAQALGWDALTGLAVAGTRVPGIALGTAVVPVAPRHPRTLASQALSVQAATGNRLRLGIGLGIGSMMSGLFGLPVDRPVRRMRDYLDQLVPLLHDTVIPGTTPPPVLLAALGPAMLRLAAERADGAITWMAGPRVLAEQCASGAEIVAGLPVCVTSDPDGARAWIAARFGMAAGVPEYRAVFDREGVTGPQDVALIGDEEQVARELDRIAGAGVAEFVGSPFGDADEQRRTMRLLGRVADGGRVAGQVAGDGRIGGDHADGGRRSR
ncbi:LLM class flavin-dependent oxidoreductase [Catenuloplanes japonicus]|uniref:LLM class flavin-dependent oxidoreductase n=1 Tax=Catenuloplanes japonicus TaxID=33876 RepID=UPI0007C4DFCC|nr:LLM class flavin-dependent oxidoreductase [Catenuloplanes japonicus]